MADWTKDDTIRVRDKAECNLKVRWSGGRRSLEDDTLDALDHIEVLEARITEQAAEIIRLKKIEHEYSVVVSSGVMSKLLYEALKELAGSESPKETPDETP